MAPVPAKALRLSELDEKDRTAYFSVTALMERGKAVAARPPEPPSTDAPPAEPTSPTPDPHVAPPTPKPGVWQQVRDASPARKAILVVLPLLFALVALKPWLEKRGPESATVTDTNASPATAALAPTRDVDSARPPVLAPTPAEPPRPLPKGMTRERAATDALSAGDYPRALELYRELSRQHPENAAYREAARILAPRKGAKQP